jgi:hypothetical protein
MSVTALVGCMLMPGAFFSHDAIWASHTDEVKTKLIIDELFIMVTK